MEPTRRTFLKATAAGLALGALPQALAQEGEQPEDLYGKYADLPAGQRGGGGYGGTTAGDIEGPFYREGAPFESALAPEGEPGRRLRLTGFVVRGLECTPVAGAVVDMWQANKEGHYDNDDPRKRPQGYHLRGRVRTDEKGRFEFTTVWPGHYQIGRDLWRPAHLHVKASGEGCAPLTTQLYFAGDPHNAKDRWFDPSRQLTPEEGEDGVWTAHYEIVLAKSE
jgi:catechol 1,2-dioxygenase